MKALHFTIILLLTLVVLVSASALTVAAAAPVNTNPAAALYIDNQTHAIEASASLWYRFDVAATGDPGARLPVWLKLLNGNNSGIGFTLYTPAQANSWFDSDTHPFGQGTTNSDDLTWMGTFSTGGPYYVSVKNSNAYPLTFQLTIAGQGVSLGQATYTSTGLKTTAAVVNTDNYHAVAIDGQPHAIPANTALWYQFAYAAGKPGDHPTVTVKLVNASNSGVGFKVLTAAQALTWDSDTHPVGQGTSYAVSCSTGQPTVNGACQSNDLTWMGRFNFSGTFYVEVINDNTYPATFQLTIQY